MSILPIATTWKDLEGKILNEMRQSEKDKHHVTTWSYSYVELETEQTENKQTKTESNKKLDS